MSRCQESKLLSRLPPFVPLSGEQRLTPPPSWRQTRTFTCLCTRLARQACKLCRAPGWKRTPGSLGRKRVFSSRAWLSHVPGKSPTPKYEQRSQERGAMQAHWARTFVSCTGVLGSCTPRVSLPCAGWSRTRSSLVSAGCLDLPFALIPLGYCFVLWYLSSFHHAVLVSSAWLVLDLRSQ